jgi:RNA polymerase sigma factor (sigma-70 family)
MAKQVTARPEFQDANTKIYNLIAIEKEKLEKAKVDNNVEVIQECSTKIDRFFEELFSKNQALLYSLAKKYIAASPDEADDYISAAGLGMWEAMRKWDPSKGGTFSTFSRSFIQGQLVRAVRTNQYAHISQTDFGKRKLVIEAKSKLGEELGRAPTVEEISENTGVHQRIVTRVLRDKPISLEAPVGEDSTTVQDLIDASFAFIELSEDTPIFDSMLRDLNDLELWLMLNRTGTLGTFKQSIIEIADELGMGREVLRRTEVRAKAKMMFTKIACETGINPEPEQVGDALVKAGVWNDDPKVDPKKKAEQCLKPSWDELKQRWDLVTESKDNKRIKLLFLEILQAVSKILAEGSGSYRIKSGEYADASELFSIFFQTFVNWDYRSEIKFPQILSKEFSKKWKKTTVKNPEAVTQEEVMQASELFWHLLNRENII